MPRKVSTGAATPVALGYQDSVGDWQSSGIGSGGAPAIDIARILTNTECGIKGVSGNNTLLAAPGVGNRIVVTAFVIQNESATATTMTIRSGTAPAPATINGWRCLGQNQGDGLSVVFAIGREWRLNENEILNFNLSGANSCGYSFSYFLEAV